MNRVICRDCGLELDADARGCPQCALNFEVEHRFDRIVWRGIVPAVFVAIAIIAALFYWSR